MPNPSASPTVTKPRTRIALTLCWLAIVFDGYDLIVYGTVAPALLNDPSWTLTPGDVGRIASLSLLGLLIGSLLVGPLADLLGRRKMIIAAVAGFSLGMALCAMTTEPGWFGFFRFLTGIGLGGLLPTMTAMIAELAPPGKRRLYHSVTFTAFPLGGILAATLAIPLIPEFGWRAMFWIGAAPLVLVLPLLLLALPESPEYRLAQAERANTPRESRPRSRGLAVLFSPRYRRSSALFALAFALNLLTTYGLLTWLPQLMTQGGYSLGSALSFLLVLNVAALALVPPAGAIADRRGSKLVCVTGFALAAISAAVLSAQPPPALAYLCVGLAGFGTIGLQIQLNTYVANYYDVSSRGSAGGWALGMGRLGAIAGPLIGGALLTAQAPQEMHFYVFAIVSALGALMILAVPRLRDATPEPAVTAPATATTAPAMTSEEYA